MFLITDGFQAIKGEMFGIPYKLGSFVDRLTKAYAEQHDLVGKQWIIHYTYKR